MFAVNIFSSIILGIILIVYIYFYRNTKVKIFLYGIVVWFLYVSKMFLYLFIKTNLNLLSLFEILNQLLTLAISYFFFASVYNLKSKKTPKLIKISLITISLWILLSSILKFNDFIILIPVYVYISFLIISAGILSFKYIKYKVVFRTIIGITLIFWGLHEIDYLLFIQYKSLMHWRPIITVSLALIISFSTIFFYFELNETETKKSIKEELLAKEELHDAYSKLFSAYTGIESTQKELEKAYQQLREREELFREVFNQTFLLAAILDKNGNIIEINDVALSTTHLPHEELAGMPFIDTPWWSHSEDERNKIAKAIKIAQKGESLTFKVTQINTKPNELREIDIVIRPIKDINEKVVYIAVEGKDISEMVHANKELKLHNERIELAMEGAQLGLWEYDAVNDELYLSKKNHELLGFDKDYVKAGEIQAIFHPDDKTEIENKFTRFLKGEDEYLSVEFRMKNKDGGWNWFLSRGKVLSRNLNGRAEKMIGIHIDITKRKQNEMLFESIFYNNPVPATISSIEDGRFLLVNEEACKLFGYKKDRLIGAKSIDLKIWGTEENRNDFVADLLENQVIKNKEGQLYNSSGSLMNILFSATIVEYKGENVLLTLIVDISPLIEIEEELKESYERLDMALNNSNQGLWEYIVNEEKLIIHKSFQKALVGQSKVNLNYLKEYISKEEYDLLKNKIDEYTNGESKKFEFEIEYKIDSENIRWVMLSGKANERDEKGKVKRILGTAIDITTRKELEYSIEKQRNLLLSIFNSSPDMFAYGDKDLNIQMINPAFSQWMDLSQEEIIGKSINELYPEYIAKKIFSEYTKVMKKNEVEERIIKLKHGYRNKNGVYIIDEKSDDKWFYEFKVPVTDNKNKIIGVIGHLRDITTLKKIEIDLQKAKESLEEKVLERTAELQKAKEKAERFNNLKNEFLAYISHEIRTPLGIISMCAQSLIEEDKVDENEKNVVQINKAVDNSVQIVDEVLDISHIEAGTMTVTKKVFNIKEMIEDIVNGFKIRINRKKLSISTDIENKSLYSDEKRIKQVVSNLLSNSIKYSRNGYIYITALVKEHELYCEVKDEGIGIAKENINKVFEPLFRVKNNDFKAKGMGLGLNICKKIVETLGGNIYLESELNKGSKFYFTIPINKD